MKRMTPILFLALLTFSCSDFKKNSEKSEEISQLRAEIDSLNKLKTENPNDMNHCLRTMDRNMTMKFSLREPLGSVILSKLS